MPGADRLAADLARLTRETKTEAGHRFDMVRAAVTVMEANDDFRNETATARVAWHW